MKQANISTDNFEFILKEFSKAGGEKIFRPKVLTVASLAECVLSSCLSFQSEAYPIKLGL